MLLAVSSAARLRTRYGEAGLFAIENALADARRRLAAAGSELEVVFPDCAGPAGVPSFPAVDMRSAGDARAALCALYRKLDGAVEGVLIVGGDEVMPHFRLPNPVTDRGLDPDAVVPTDNPYGVLSDPETQRALAPLLVPELPVGRLPDPDPPRLPVLLAAIERLGRRPRGGRQGIFGVVDPSWQQSAGAVVASAPATLRASPGWTSGDPEWSRQRAALLYFNLHGFADRPGWRGFDRRNGRWTDSVQPRHVGPEMATGAVVVAENCYGANLLGRAGHRSVAAAFLRRGCHAFIGATGLAFGNQIGELRDILLSNADAMAGTLIERLFGGATFGAALRAARTRLLGGGARTTFEQKTALQFVLFGNPLATLDGG